MKEERHSVAYIDGANLHNALKELGWKLDYRRFRFWLKQKYNIDLAYIFLGNIPKYSDLYGHLQECGFALMFKEVVYDGEGKAKGNCDADLVLKVARDSYEGRLHRAIIVSSDGDYTGLVRFLQEKEQLLTIISPAISKKCSILLKRTDAPIAYINDQRSILEKWKKENPRRGHQKIPRKGFSRSE